MHIVHPGLSELERRCQGGRKALARRRFAIVVAVGRGSRAYAALAAGTSTLCHVAAGHCCSLLLGPEQDFNLALHAVRQVCRFLVEANRRVNCEENQYGAKDPAENSAGATLFRKAPDKFRHNRSCVDERRRDEQKMLERHRVVQPRPKTNTGRVKHSGISLQRRVQERRGVTCAFSTYQCTRVGQPFLNVSVQCSQWHPG